MYRGQDLSPINFDQIKTTQGGLIAFNNFLSTSYNHDVSLRFARRTIRTASNLVGVKEEELLFSMHSVFRIGQVKQIEENDRFWQAGLTLTGENDPQLQTLTKSTQAEITGSTGWFRLGKLMMGVPQFDKAEQVFDTILKQTVDERGKGDIYHQLGMIKDEQGKYTEAMTYYRDTLNIRQKNSSSKSS